MNYNKFKNNYCLKFEHSGILSGRKYSIKVIDKATNGIVKTLFIEYIDTFFEKTFGSTDLKDPEILEKIKMALVKGILIQLGINYSGQVLDDLFC